MSRPLPVAPDDSASLQRLGAEAAEELRRAVAAELTRLLGPFFQQLPQALTQAAAKIGKTVEGKSYENLARNLPSQRARWSDTFLQHVDAQLIGGVAQEHKGGQTSMSGEDAVVLAKLQLAAEARYQKLITELDARLNRVRLTVYVPIYTRALAPAGLGQSLQAAADEMGWPPKQRRILFEQFDALVINQLEQLYRALLDTLKRIGIAAAKVAAEAPGARPRSPAPGPAKGLGPAPKVDAATLSMLQSFALSTDGDGYTDGLLAADLMALADNRPLPGLAQDTAWIQLQRISLAGEFFNEAVTDPLVPAEMRPHHETMRFPLVKSALTDATLFTAASHPLRSLVDDLMLKSATSRLSGDAETRRTAEKLQEVLVQFDLSPEFVRHAMLSAQPIDEGQVQRFMQLQKQQAEQRRKFVITEAKRLVLRHLETCTFGRGIPAPAVAFLQTAWGPLLTKRLLQYGGGHPQYKAALELLDQVLEQLDARKPKEPPSAEWQKLLRAMGELLLSEGLGRDKVTAAVTQLEAARRTEMTNSPF